MKENQLREIDKWNSRKNRKQGNRSTYYKS